MRLGHILSESLFILKYKYNSAPCIPGCDPMLQTNSPKIQHSVPISLFPNPANEEFTVHSEIGFNFGSWIEVSDFTGRQLFKYSLQGDNTTISTLHLEAGMYECKIYNNGYGIETQKLVIIR